MVEFLPSASAAAAASFSTFEECGLWLLQHPRLKKLYIYGKYWALEPYESGSRREPHTARAELMN